MKRSLGIIILVIASLSAYSQESKDEIDFRREAPQTVNQRKSGYQFEVKYRIAADYIQQWEHSDNKTYPNTYFHGGRIGVEVDFMLPYNLSVHSGLKYALTYGHTNQHFGLADTANSGEQYLNHRILKHTLTIPAQISYEQHLWRKLSMFFFAGPEFSIGLSQHDKITANMADATLNWLKTQNIQTDSYDKYSAKELYRFNLLFDLGGGFQWDKYRLQAGYNFGLLPLVNNSVASTKRQMTDWNWFVGFSYLF